MAKPFKLGKNYYRIRVAMGKGPDGKYQVYSENFRGDPNAAKQRQRELEAARDAQTLEKPACELTLTDLYEEYIARITREQTHEANTLKNYQFNWPRLQVACGDELLVNITREHVMAYREMLYSSYYMQDEETDPKDRRRLAESTMRKHVGFFKILLTYAVERGYIKNHPAYRMRSGPPLKKTAQVLNKTEISLVLELLQLEPLLYRTAFTLLLNTGLRRGELYGLQWRDIEVMTVNGEEICLIHVRRSAVHIKRQQWVKTPKTATSLRVIGVPMEVYRLLQMWRSVFTDVSETDYILRWPETGKWIQLEHLSRVWPKFLQRHNLPAMRLHDGRHTYVSRLINAGVDLLQVQYLVGHAYGSTTLNVYGHLITNPALTSARAMTHSAQLSAQPDRKTE